jgi:hypothetical protein
MSSRAFGSRAAIAVAALTLASLARADLPGLQAEQVLRPAREDVQPDPEQPPSEATFGDDVAIQGNVALVSMSDAHDGAGRVAVFVRGTDGIWIRSATLTPDDAAPGAHFGKSIALSGRHALIASSNAIYLFEHAGSSWQQRQKIALASAVTDVAFAGQLAVVGTGEVGSGNNGAFAFHLSRDGRLHTVAQIVPSDVQQNDRFGARVAISGSTVAITAPGYNATQGAAYLYTCVPVGCWQNQKLLATDGEPSDSFGSAIDVRDDALVIGASNADSVFGNDFEEHSEQNFTAMGAVYAFVRLPSGTWTETQKFRPTPQQHNWYFNFGLSVALAADRIVVGAPYGFTQFEPGKIFIYRNIGGTFEATHAIVGALGLGQSTSLSGSTLFSGAPQEDLYRGQAEIYSVP